MKRVCAGVSAGVIVVVVVAVLVWYFGSSCFWPRSFSEEVQCRCSSYAPPPDAPLRVDKDCKKIAEAFTNAFISKDPCHVRAEDYQPLMELVNQAIPRDKVLFWSKTKELKKPYKKAGGRLLTLEDMLVGHIADNLMWCGDRNTSEVQLDSCPEESNTCPHPAAGVFWNVSSKWLAKTARGQVHALLSGSITDTYNETSVFGSVEVPNLSSDVSELLAWVIYEHRNTARNFCSKDSIKLLESHVLEKGAHFSCEDMDRETFLQCVENPETSQCKSVE